MGELEWPVRIGVAAIDLDEGESNIWTGLSPRDASRVVTVDAPNQPLQSTGPARD